MVGLIIIGILILIVSYAWAIGTDKIQEEYPEYKGEEFLNWDRDHDKWDNNHTEGEFH